jgi:hypothetical protein
MSPRGFSRILSAWVGLGYVLTASTGAVSAETGAINTLPTSAVRDGFINCGFFPNGATVSANGTFAVVDKVEGTGDQRRVLMVAVYADAASAQDAYNQAAANTGSTTSEWNSDRGPLLYANYGPSVWRGNVSLSQSDLRMLSGLYRVVSQTGELVADSEAAATLHDDLWHRTSAVDLDFVKCLDFVIAAPSAPVGGEIF